MPNLPHLVTSLELSKRLKELGMKQESLFYWEKINEIRDEWDIRIEYGIYDFDCPHETLCSAYTAGELGEMLPDSIIKDGTLYVNGFYKVDKNWASVYEDNDDNEKCLTGTHAENEVDSRAKLLIYLITSNLINVKG